MKQFLTLQSGIFKVNKHQFSLGQKATFIVQFQLHKIDEYLITYLQLSLARVLKYMLICQLLEDDEIFR